MLLLPCLPHTRACACVSCVYVSVYLSCECAFPRAVVLGGSKASTFRKTTSVGLACVNYAAYRGRPAGSYQGFPRVMT